MAWVLTGAATLVAVLGAVVLVILVTSADSGIPVVSDIDAELGDAGRIEFSWSDPGLADGDRYRIDVTDDGIASAPTVQSADRFVVDGDPGDTICLTVTVNRNGTTGSASADKCVVVTGD